MTKIYGAKIYGYIKKRGYAIGDEYERFLISECSRREAAEIVLDYDFINRYNMNSIEKIYKITIEVEGIEEDEQ